MARRLPKIEAIDLFCGAGGLTAGLRKVGVQVRAGYDIDSACRYAYEHNNSAEFVLKDVEAVEGLELKARYSEGAIRLLAGCAPCQPFSIYNQGRDAKLHRKWPLLYSFQRLIGELRPELVTMENVPDVTKHEVYHDFVSNLTELGYHVWASKIDCSTYGLPQRRFRHVLLASLLGPIELKSTASCKRATVRDAIGGLPAVASGETDANDPLHTAARLSDLNLRRIRASRPGGTWNDWPPALRAQCHLRETGRSYPSVYGRMSWDEPSPTMTTLCYGFGNGRFGHPTQDRGITLREAALLQSFPPTYQFSAPDQIQFRAIGRMIGNAVPVRLGEVIGDSLLKHTRNALKRP